MVEVVMGGNWEFQCPGGNPEFQCPCGKWYSSRASLRRHVRYECGKEPQFKCPFCPKRCNRKANLFSHIRIRHKDRQLSEEQRRFEGIICHVDEPKQSGRQDIICR